MAGREMVNAEGFLRRRVMVVGGGPAGLMAAETLVREGQGSVEVEVFDAMPTLARKLLLAGKGGLNLTHAEPFEDFVRRYGCQQARLTEMLERFGPTQLRAWAAGLGVATFVGSSGRVFPVDMKAAPLLRAWLQRLRAAGVRFHMRHRWLGWDMAEAAAGPNLKLRFDSPEGVQSLRADAVVLALGGGSWPRLGADGGWVEPLRGCGVAVAPLRPANCGFDVAGGWSEHFVGRFAGQPVKSVMLGYQEETGQMSWRRGEFVLTGTGVEGSLIYALSARLRDAIEAQGAVQILLDLLPDRTAADVLAEVSRPRGARSLSSHLQSRLGLKGVRAGLLRELTDTEVRGDPQRLASAIKALPLRLATPRPLVEAISSAGGVCFEALDERLMLRSLPGVFCAGEMLDWEAPTGGYLLTASFSTGHAAGLGALNWLAR
jgi:uncharacterized flavoprotein (TIGR03862 family)